MLLKGDRYLSSGSDFEKGSFFFVLAETASFPKPMTSMAHQARDGDGQFLGLEPEWPGLALVCDPASCVDQIHAIRPAGVGAFG